jgi:hypothetical protein
MSRALIIAVACLGYQTFLVAFAVSIGVEAIPLVVAPLLITYAVFFQGLLDALVAIFAVGFLVDAVSGMPIGTNMALIFVLWFGARAALGWLGKPHWSVIFIFVVVISLLYRLLLGATLYFFTQSTGNIEWFSLVWPPLADGLVGIVFLRVLYKILVQLRLTESMEDASSRLSSRRTYRAR